MGVEPTGDRAERPPSRFEDGEAHRDLYTSMFAPFAYMCDKVRGCNAILPCAVWLVKPAIARA